MVPAGQRKPLHAFPQNFPVAVQSWNRQVRPMHRTYFTNISAYEPDS